MSASQDSSQKFYEYDSDDRQLLVGLLHEYSEKLVEASRKIARSRTNEKVKKTSLYLFIGFFLCSLMPLFSCVKTNGFLNRDSLVIILLSNAALILTLLITLNSYKASNWISTSWLKEVESALLEKDAKMIANRLESAMRLTVEIADRVETNLARKLELDLRIDDAASALEYYYSVVNLKSKSQSKSRKVATLRSNK
jgi:hypothetical protein